MGLILFDIDCTLLRLGGAGMRNLGKATRQILGFDFEGSDIRPDGWTDPLILRELLRQRQVPPEHWVELEAEVWDLYAAFLEEELSQPTEAHRLEPGVRPLLERLEAEGHHRLGLLTGNLERTARLKLAPFGLNVYFPIGAYGSDCADRNRLGLVALERARRHYGEEFRPQDTWVVGDTPRDVAAAHAFGARALAVATGYYTPAQLEEHLPEAVMDDLSELDRVLQVLA